MFANCLTSSRRPGSRRTILFLALLPSLALCLLGTSLSAAPQPPRLAGPSLLSVSSGPAGANILTDAVLTEIRNSISVDSTAFDQMVADLDAGMSSLNYWNNTIIGGMLRLRIAHPSDRNYRRYSIWYKQKYLENLDSTVMDPTRGGRNRARSYMGWFLHAFVWGDAGGFWSASERSRIIRRFGTWWDEWYAWLDKGNRDVFVPVDSDETAFEQESWLLFANILTGTRAAQARAEYKHVRDAIADEYLGDDGVFARGSWNEAPSYDDETPVLYSRWHRLAEQLDEFIPAPDYPERMAEFALYTATQNYRGRFHQNDNQGSNKNYYQIQGAMNYSPGEDIKEYVDGLMLNLKPDTDTYRALFWLADRYRDEDDVSHKEFHHYADRVFAERRHRETLPRGNPWSTMGWPLHRDFLTLFTAKEQPEGGAQVLFWKQRPWHVDHIMWKAGSFEIFDTDDRGEVVPITMNTPNVFFSSDQQMLPENTIYIENAGGGDLFPGFMQRRIDFASFADAPNPKTIGSAGSDRDFAYNAYDMTALFWVNNKSRSGGFAKATRRVQRTMLWLPTLRMLLAHDRVVLDPSQVADIRKAPGYIREIQTVVKTEAMPTPAPGGFVQAAAHGKRLFYKQLLGGTTQSLADHKRPPWSTYKARIGNTWNPAQQKYHITQSVRSADAEMLHLLAYGPDGSTAVPAASRLIDRSGRVTAWKLNNGTVVVFNRSGTPLAQSVTLEDPAGALGGAIDVYAAGFDTRVGFTASRTSNTLSLTATGSGIRPTSSEGTYGLLRLEP